MFHLALVFLALLSVHASPILDKRIAQVIIDATTPWETACLAAKGGEQCNPAAVAAAETLLAAAGNCAQQNAADNLVNISKMLGSSQMLSLAQVFVQQPRNTPNSVAVPYCDQAPANSELNGLFQCQYIGANLATFVGGLSVGQPGTIPFGHSGPVTPPGSCPANPGGPIAAGSQLVDITTNPGVPGGSATPPPASSTSADSCPAPTSSTTSAPTKASPSPVSLATGGFKLANGQAAQKLNAQFSTLTADSPCTAGENACVNGDFAQCIGGKFVMQPCAASLTCVAVPLVNSAGTSIICDTQSDALARMAASGVSGGLTG